jgi:hypothetical protein
MFDYRSHATQNYVYSELTLQEFHDLTEDNHNWYNY